MKKYDFSGSICRLSLVGLFAASASTVAANAQVETAPATDNSARMKTVTVTGRKRTESIQDVPFAVTSMDERDVELLVLDDVTDFLRQLPGATLVPAGPSYLNDISIRGQGGGRLGFSESSTGIYRDGVFVGGGGFGGRTFSKIDFFDMQNLEVYRGPQGALFGRNAVGGAANVISHKPTDDTSLKIGAGYNDLDQYDLSFIANVPLVKEVLNARVGGYVSEQDKGYHKLEGTDQYLDTESDYGLRGAVRWQVNGKSTIDLTLEHSNSVAPGFASLGYNTVIDPGPFERRGLNLTDTVEIEQTTVIGQLDWNFHFADLVVISSYTSRDGDRENGDLDHFIGLNFPFVDLIDEQFEEYERFSAEVRLSSPNSTGFSWLIGADYLGSQSDIISDRPGTLTGPFATNAALLAILGRDESSEELESFSAFGSFGWDLTEQLNLSIEARVQSDSKEYDFEHIDYDPTTVNTVLPTTFYQDSTRFLPAVSLMYQLNDNDNVYGRFATGYRPGGFNPSPAIGFFDQASFDPETAQSVEFGWKRLGTFGNIRVQTDVAVYYTWTDDILMQTSLSTLDSRTSLQNVGDATQYGLEASLKLQKPMFGGTARANFGFSSSGGKFSDGSSVTLNGTVYDLSGARTPRNRDYIANMNLAFMRPLFSNLDGFGSVSFQAEGGGYDNSIGDLNVPASRSSESFELLDVRLGVESDGWQFSVFGKNITDETYRTVTLNQNEFYSTGSLFGAQFSVEF